MGLPNQPVTLSAEQLQELERKLARMRHDVNGYLSVIVAANELILLKPDAATRWISMLSEQPTKIKEAVAHFSADFDKVFGITRP